MIRNCAKNSYSKRDKQIFDGNDDKSDGNDDKSDGNDENINLTSSDNSN
jgi:hypothetical protein